MISRGKGLCNEAGPKDDVESSNEASEDGKHGVFVAENGPPGDVVLICLEARLLLCTISSLGKNILKVLLFDLSDLFVGG